MTRRLIAALALLPLLAACSASDTESSDVSNGGASEAPADGSSGEGGGDGSIDVPSFPDDGRLLIIRMTVGLEVTDVGDAVDELLTVADDHDAQLSSSNVDLADRDNGYGELVFRVPPDEVDSFIEGLDPAVGRTASLESSTEDVTLEVRDLEAQLAAAEISVERVKALLEGATKLADIILLEGELAARQTRLDQLRAQKAYYDQQVALSTITVRLWKAPADIDTSDGGVIDKISDAFARGWDAFATFAVGLVLAVGYGAPFLAVLAVAGLIALIVRRRQRRNRSVAPPHPPAPAEDRQTS